MIDKNFQPDMPDHVRRVTIDTSTWAVEFYVDAFPNDFGDIWQDLEGDYLAAKFAVASTVCEIPDPEGWGEWDCYPEGDGWIVFADNNGEDGHPQGSGETIANAIRNAIAQYAIDSNRVSVADLPATF